MNDHASFQWPALPGPWRRISASFWLAFLSTCLIGGITHLYLFTNLLLNHDSATQTYTANNVLSSGRWALEFLSAFSARLQMPVVIGLISILALAVAAGLTVRVLELSHPVHIVLACALLATFPVRRRPFQLSVHGGRLLYLSHAQRLGGVLCQKLPVRLGGRPPPACGGLRRVSGLHLLHHRASPV